jgi:hypothetical protein
MALASIMTRAGRQVILKGLSVKFKHVSVSASLVAEHVTEILQETKQAAAAKRAYMDFSIHKLRVPFRGRVWEARERLANRIRQHLPYDTVLISECDGFCEVPCKCARSHLRIMLDE